MKAIFFKYHADHTKRDLRDGAENICGLIDPDFRSHELPIWSVCGPYVRKTLEIGDVVFFLPIKSKAKKAGIWNGYSSFTGVLVVDKTLTNMAQLLQDPKISSSYKRKYKRSLLNHLNGDRLQTRNIRPQRIILGSKAKSMWIWPKQKFHVSEFSNVLDLRDFAKRRVPFLVDKKKIKSLYHKLTNKQL